VGTLAASIHRICGQSRRVYLLRLSAHGEARDEENLIVYRGPQAFVILNAFPYSNGHLMSFPIGTRQPSTPSPTQSFWTSSI